MTLKTQVLILLVFIIIVNYAKAADTVKPTEEYYGVSDKYIYKYTLKPSTSDGPYVLEVSEVWSRSQVKEDNENNGFWKTVDLGETAIKMQIPPCWQKTVTFGLIDSFKTVLKHPAVLPASAKAKQETLGKVAPLYAGLTVPGKEYEENLKRDVNEISGNPDEYDSLIKDLRKIPVGIVVGSVVNQELGDKLGTGGSVALSEFGTQLINNNIDQKSSTSPSQSPTASQSSESYLKSDLGGVNFTSIKLNCISVYADGSGKKNFNLVLRAERSKEANNGIDIQNATRIGVTSFLTGLAVPDNKFLVRLDPKDPDRIIDEELAQSDVGRIMLEADLQMKKDIHYYDNPCANKTGKAQWDLLDTKREALVQKCMDRYPGEIENIYNVWFMPVTRFWIIPDKVYAYTNGTQIYIINATLTIESEPETDDSFVQINNQDIRTLSKGCLEELNKSAKEYGEYYKELNNRMILPYVIADVNYGEKYEDLRNVYVALALAQWYKSRVTPHMDIFRDSLESSRSIVLSALRPWSPREIWNRYIYSYKNGEYKCWENTTTKTARRSHTEYRSRQAGGVSFGGIKDHMVEIEGVPPKVQNQVNMAIIMGYADEKAEVLFGNRLFVPAKENTLTTGSNAGSSQKSTKQNAEAEEGSSENRTDNAAHLPNEMVSGQNNTAPPKLASSGSTIKVTCPEGWMGPDEKGECWQMQIMS